LIISPARVILAGELTVDFSDRNNAHPNPAGQKLFAISMRCGRLANRMVLFANFIAFAEEHGYRVSNVTFHSYSPLFRETAPDIYCRYPLPLQRSLWDMLPGAAPVIRTTRIFYHVFRLLSRLNERLRPFGRKVVTLRELPGLDVTLLDAPEIQARISDATTVFVYDWRFRAPEAVRKHAGVIRAFFRPIEKVEQDVDKTLARLRQRAPVVIGVHIRRGDYRDWQQGRFYFDIPRYAAWMREMTKQFPDRQVAFFVSSDETLSHRQFEGLPVEIGAGPPVNDLYTLAGTDFVFGPPSTFSQWASFYGQTPLLHLRGDSDHVELGRFRVSYFDEVT